ncbi:MAG: hypothetical protein WAW17_33435 [Rhodococcus sp. (in: high G+C Gram-positive bacteria)]|uniref:hypothetical protein n=1 Tax=Rhodococcus sp. TaxID=1831 RepID=UPI003BAF4FC1
MGVTSRRHGLGDGTGGGGGSGGGPDLAERDRWLENNLVRVIIEYSRVGFGPRRGPGGTQPAAHNKPPNRRADYAAP